MEHLIFRKLRAHIGCTQEELGKVLGLTAKTINDFENGKRTPCNRTWHALAFQLVRSYMDEVDMPREEAELIYEIAGAGDQHLLD